MSQQIGFAEALDAAERLDADAQAELVAVLSRRLAELRCSFFRQSQRLLTYRGITYLPRGVVKKTGWKP